MREHEVPTHVQAEDRVLLWLTFPQIVAVTAVCALSYGAYRYAPFGPSGVRMALAAVPGLCGVAMVVGKIGGRRLPLVAADLLRFWLGARQYAGQVGELVRSEALPPPPSTPGPVELMAKRARRSLRKMRKKRRVGRTPFRAHRWFGKRRRRTVDEKVGKGKPRRWKRWRIALALAVVAAAAWSMPGPALADGHTLDEVDFRPPERVLGRRLFVEGLRIAGGWAEVDVRAATRIDAWVRGFGGPEGRSMLYWGRASLEEGDRRSFRFPLTGPAPYATFSWRDSIGEAGAFSLQGDQLPFPLPSVSGEMCDLEVTSLSWSGGEVEGTLSSACSSKVEERVDLAVLSGHRSLAIAALLMGSVTNVEGEIAVDAGGSRSISPLVPGGETVFRLTVPVGEAVHAINVEVGLEATLDVAVPALAQLTLHVERSQQHTQTVSLLRPGASRTVSKIVTVTHDDGTSTEHTISAVLSIPSATVQRDVTVTIVHPEHVRAEVVARESITRRRMETAALAFAVGSDAPFEALELPEPVEETGLGEQTPLSDELTAELFERIGWRWQR